MRAKFEVVLSKQVVVMIRIMPVCVRFVGSRNPRINRGLLKVRIIVLKVGVGFFNGRQARDRSVTVKDTIRSGSRGSEEFPKIVVSRTTQIPVAIKDAVLQAAAELE